MVLLDDYITHAFYTPPRAFVDLLKGDPYYDVRECALKALVKLSSSSSLAATTPAYPGLLLRHSVENGVIFDFPPDGPD